MQRIIPFLWYANEAEEAANHYVSAFVDVGKKAKITAIDRYTESSSEASGRPKGSVMTVSFELDGMQFVALNGGPTYKFSPAVSFMVNCKTQKEIDGLWDKLSAGGKQIQCGWLEDKFGLSWQIVPEVFRELTTGPDPKKTERVMAAMLKMTKMDIAELKKAYEG